MKAKLLGLANEFNLFKDQQIEQTFLLKFENLLQEACQGLDSKDSQGWGSGSRGASDSQTGKPTKKESSSVASQLERLSVPRTSNNATSANKRQSSQKEQSQKNYLTEQSQSPVNRKVKSTDSHKLAVAFPSVEETAENKSIVGQSESEQISQ